MQAGQWHIILPNKIAGPSHGIIQKFVCAKNRNAISPIVFYIFPHSFVFKFPPSPYPWLHFNIVHIKFSYRVAVMLFQLIIVWHIRSPFCVPTHRLLEELNVYKTLFHFKKITHTDLTTNK